MSTIKLHYALYHVADQMATLGFLYKFQEYWIERMVGYVKDSIHGNSTRCPEVTFAKVHLTKLAAAHCRCVLYTPCYIYGIYGCLTLVPCTAVAAPSCMHRNGHCAGTPTRITAAI